MLDHCDVCEYGNTTLRPHPSLPVRRSCWFRQSHVCLLRGCLRWPRRLALRYDTGVIPELSYSSKMTLRCLLLSSKLSSVVCSQGLAVGALLGDASRICWAPPADCHRHYFRGRCRNLRGSHFTGHADRRAHYRWPRHRTILGNESPSISQEVSPADAFRGWTVPPFQLATNSWEIPLAYIVDYAFAKSEAWRDVRSRVAIPRGSLW